MKNLKIVALVCIMALFTVDALGWSPVRRPRPIRHHDRQSQNPGAVGTPIDGGILAILGAAGVAYFVARKRKKS